VTDCWAVGRSYGANGNSQTLVEQDAGNGWILVSSPAPSGSSSSEFNGVACPSVADCWAVGDSSVRGGGQSTLIEQNTGSGWSIVPSPSPFSGGSNELAAVTCVNVSDCWAVGDDSDSSGVPIHPLIEENTGSGWSVVSNPSSSDSGSLQAVTCVNADDCWAVGASGSSSLLVEQETGSGWTVVPSPAPSGSSNGGFDGVMCASVSQCWTVGEYSLSIGNNQSVIEQNTGGGWTIVSTPTLAGSVSSEFLGATCGVAAACWIVGVTTDASAIGHALIEEDAEASLSVVAAPTPSGSSSSELEAVTCASVTDCWAVGSFDDGGDQTLIEQTKQSGQ
jgi:hypothetical protein